MRIGFDAKRIFHNFRGLGNYSRNLVEGLIRHFPEEEYILFTPPLKDPRGIEWKQDLPDLKLRTPRSYWGQSLPSFWRSFSLAGAIGRDKLDLYHGLSHELPLGIQKTKSKTLVTIHDLIFMRYPHFFPWIDRQIYYQKYRHAIEKADLIIAICEQTKRDLIHFFKTPQEKIKVVYQSCHPLFFSKPDPKAWGFVKQKFKLTRPYILSVGAIEERKNILLLVRAFCRLKNLIPHHLVLVGEGREYKKRLYEEIEKNRVSERVLFLKGVENRELPDLYRHGDLFVYPSLFEGWGIPNVEALFCRIPVITSRGSSLQESAGPNSLFIDPSSVEELAHQMEKVLFDKGLRENMVAQGYSYAQQFHWKNTSERVMSVYRSLVGSP